MVIPLNTNGAASSAGEAVPIISICDTVKLSSTCCNSKQSFFLSNIYIYIYILSKESLKLLTVFELTFNFIEREYVVSFNNVNMHLLSLSNIPYMTSVANVV